VETMPNFPNGVYVAAEQYIAENGDVVDRFASAMNRSLEYADAHPEEVRRIVPTYTETPEEAAQQMRLPVFDSELDRAGIELEADLTAKYGIIEEAPAYEELVQE
jgi:NitT/TauT family transport system substrate-binding protein